jgi:hypothetical protein
MRRKSRHEAKERIVRSDTEDFSSLNLHTTAKVLGEEEERSGERGCIALIRRGMVTVILCFSAAGFLL